MKNLVLLILVVSVALTSKAQVETLIEGETSQGWCGGTFFKVDQFDKNTHYYLGIQGGLVSNSTFIFGGKGYMLVNPYKVDGLNNITVGFLAGGPYFEYMIASHKLINFSAEVMFGPGYVYNDVGSYSEPYDPIDYTGQSCFVIEPGFNIKVNILENMKLGIGATYRIVNGLDYDAGAPYQQANTNNHDLVDDSNLSGLSTQVTLVFGIF